MTAERACVPDAEREREKGGGGRERTTARDGIPRGGWGGTKVWIVKQQRRREGAGARCRERALCVCAGAVDRERRCGAKAVPKGHRRRTFGEGTEAKQKREGKPARSGGDDVDDGRIIHSAAQKKGEERVCVCMCVCVHVRERRRSDLRSRRVEVREQRDASGLASLL